MSNIFHPGRRPKSGICLKRVSHSHMCARYARESDVSVKISAAEINYPNVWISRGLSRSCARQGELIFFSYIKGKFPSWQWSLWKLCVEKWIYWQLKDEPPSIAMCAVPMVKNYVLIRGDRFIDLVSSFCVFPFVLSIHRHVFSALFSPFSSLVRFWKGRFFQRVSQA